MAFAAPLLGALGGAGATAGGLGTALSVGSGILGTVAAFGQANYQAQVAKNNSELAARNAQLASDKAQQEQLTSDQETAALLGQQLAVQSASGLSIDGASQLRTRRSAQRIGRTDARNIREQGNYEIQGFQQQAENFRAEAKAQKGAAIGALIGGGLDIAGSLAGKPSLIGGSSSVRNKNKYDPWKGLR